MTFLKVQRQKEYTKDWAIGNVDRGVLRVISSLNLRL